MAPSTPWSSPTWTSTPGRTGLKSLIHVTTFLGRTLAEFWHWFVANIPGDSVEDGEVTFATTTFPQDVSSLGHF